MPRTCECCVHAAARRIDMMLRSGSTQSYVAKKFGLSRSSVSRHVSRHLHEGAQGKPETSAPEATAMTDDFSFALKTPQDVLDAMRYLVRRVWGMVNRAEADGDIGNAIKALSLAERNLESFWAKWSKLIEEKPRLVNPVVNIFEGVSTEALIELRDALRQEREAKVVPALSSGARL